MRFLLALLGTNLRAAYALRGSFWLSVAFMILNNLIFFTVWLIYFHRFETVNGWNLADMSLLYGIVSFAWGLEVAAAGGLRNLAQTISDGDLDGFLVQPKPALLYVAASRSFPSGFGDMLSGTFLIAMSGYVSPASAPLIVLVLASSCVIFCATSVIAHSLAFWLGAINSLAREFSDFLIMFSGNPQTIYTGFLRVLLFTILPAGFIGYLPVEAIRALAPGKLAGALAGAAIYGALALWTFRRGLARYESGNRFGVRG